MNNDFFFAALDFKIFKAKNIFHALQMRRHQLKPMCVQVSMYLHEYIEVISAFSWISILASIRATIV